LKNQILFHQYHTGANMASFKFSTSTAEQLLSD